MRFEFGGPVNWLRKSVLVAALIFKVIWPCWLKKRHSTSLLYTDLGRCYTSQTCPCFPVSQWVKSVTDVFFSPFPELLELVNLQSREFQHEVLPVLLQSFKDRQVAPLFRFTQAWLIHNDDFLQQVSQEDVLTWKSKQHYWPFVRRISLATCGFAHRGPVMQSLFLNADLNKLLDKQLSFLVI